MWNHNFRCHSTRYGTDTSVKPHPVPTTISLTSTVKTMRRNAHVEENSIEWRTKGRITCRDWHPMITNVPSLTWEIDIESPHSYRNWLVVVTTTIITMLIHPWRPWCVVDPSPWDTEWNHNPHVIPTPWKCGWTRFTPRLGKTTMILVILPMIKRPPLIPLNRVPMNTTTVINIPIVIGSTFVVDTVPMYVVVAALAIFQWTPLAFHQYMLCTMSLAPRHLLWPTPSCCFFLSFVRGRFVPWPSAWTI